MGKIKKIILIFGILLLSIFLVSADGDHQTIAEEGKKLVESEINCDKLSDEQLEAIGDYYMEQMHPGESHDLMDKMMGGEGSESLGQMHIQMAKRLYCNEYIGGMTSGIMGMMGGGMMNMAMGTGMMGNFGYGTGYGTFINFLSLLLAIGLVVLVYLWIIKLWKDLSKKKHGK